MSDPGKNFDQSINVRRLGVKVTGSAGGRGDAKTFQEWESGEVAGANGDASFVKSADDFGRSATFQGEREDRDAIGSVCGAEDAETRDTAQAFEGLSGEGLLALPDFSTAEGFEVLNRGD